jgi:hypothetical protein
VATRSRPSTAPTPPLSLEAAKHDQWVSSLPFPDSATSIYYVYHAGGMQEFEFFVRFTVDPNDLERAVSDLLTDHDKTTRAQHSYTSVPIANAPPPPDEPLLLHTSWWNPRSITNGYSRGSTNRPPFHIWVDTNRHTIYLCETD